MSNMRQLHIALALYRGESGGDVTYGTPAEMGLPTGATPFFRQNHQPCRGVDPSSCGPAGGFAIRWPTGIPAAFHDPAADERWAQYVRKYGEQAVIVMDVSHQLSCPISEYSTGRALGLRLDGSAKFRVRFGDPTTAPGWWHDD